MAEDPGDDSMVLRVVARLLPAGDSAFTYEGGGNAASLTRDPDGAWIVILTLLRPQGRRHYTLHFRPNDSGKPSGERYTWGLARLGPRTWDLTPSVHVPADLHCFVTLQDVPEPPPWA